MYEAGWDESWTRDVIEERKRVSLILRGGPEVEADVGRRVLGGTCCKNFEKVCQSE